MIDSIYPNIDLIMIVELNDNPKTKRTVNFNVNNKDKDNINNNEKVYNTLKSKEDINLPFSRILIPIEISEIKNNIIKINISFHTYTNNKLLYICNSEMYLNIKGTKNNEEIKKYKIFKNLYQKYNHLKIGNLVFNFGYYVKNFCNNNNDDNNNDDKNSAFKLSHILNHWVPYSNSNHNNKNNYYTDFKNDIVLAKYKLQVKYFL
jgi:hypothetical protein